MITPTLDFGRRSGASAGVLGVNVCVRAGKMVGARLACEKCGAANTLFRRARQKAIYSPRVTQRAQATHARLGRSVAAKKTKKAARARARRTTRTHAAAALGPTALWTPHGLRAGGAVMLRCAGYSDAEIMRAGRWKSMSFCIYEVGERERAEMRAGRIYGLLPVELAVAR